MSSQFVDINADGFKDIVAGSFSGTPQIIMGGENGYQQAKPILDRDGEIVLISAFWNDEDSKWDKSDRSDSEGHCTSVSVVDWDADGDFDLLLGDYYGGKLFLKINEGTAKEPKFATANVAVEAAGAPVVIQKGLATPVVVDWDNDGLFDILCGGSKGGVFFFRNTGVKGSPAFAAATTLLEPVDKTDSFIGRVPSFKNQPTQPGSSIHIEPVDYDGDGDLDLLVGGRSSWLTDDAEELTEKEQARFEKLKGEMAEASQRLSAMIKGVDEDKREELTASDEYKDAIKAYSNVSREYSMLNKKADPSKSGDFIWLFRQK